MNDPRNALITLFGGFAVLCLVLWAMPRQDTTAQDADADRIAALETQVADLTARYHDLSDREIAHEGRISALEHGGGSGDALPPAVPAANLNNPYTAEQYYGSNGFSLRCRIEQHASDYGLTCIRVAP